MKKKMKGPMWKKGQVMLPPVYHPPVELEANLTEEQKKWPVVTELLPIDANTDTPPLVPATADPPPQPPPAA